MTRYRVVAITTATGKRHWWHSHDWQAAQMWAHGLRAALPGVFVFVEVLTDTRPAALREVA